MIFKVISHDSVESILLDKLFFRKLYIFFDPLFLFSYEFLCCVSFSNDLIITQEIHLEYSLWMNNFVMMFEVSDSTEYFFTVFNATHELLIKLLIFKGFVKVIYA